MAEAVNASNDFFIRTSDTRHTDRVAEVIQRVYDNGHVYEGTYEGWYCPRCADFKTERELGPGNTCPIHEIPLELETEQNWFFRLSAFQDRLVELYEREPLFVVPDFRRNEALSFIKGGLQDVSLSRAKLEWGMRLPWDPEPAHVRVVRRAPQLLHGAWVRARGRGPDRALLAGGVPPARQGHPEVPRGDLAGALLMAAEIEPPTGMVIHGYLLMGEKKMSKSLGNVLDPFEAIERFGADALRFYCLREVSFGQDGSVSAAGFESRYETELANDFGNLASRTLAMIDRYRDGRCRRQRWIRSWPAVTGGLEGLGAEVSDLIDRSEPSQALEAIWVRVRRVNRYVEETRPWDLSKDDSEADRLDQVLYSLVEALRVLTLALLPYMPESAEKLLGALSEEERGLGEFGSKGGGYAVERIPPLFPKLDP